MANPKVKDYSSCLVVVFWVLVFDLAVWFVIIKWVIE